MATYGINKLPPQKKGLGNLAKILDLIPQNTSKSNTRSNLPSYNQINSNNNYCQNNCFNCPLKSYSPNYNK